MPVWQCTYYIIRLKYLESINQLISMKLDSRIRNLHLFNPLYAQYFQVNFLLQLSPSSDQSQQTAAGLIYATVCRYLNDFLLVYCHSPPASIRKEPSLDEYLTKRGPQIHADITRHLLPTAVPDFLAVSIGSQLVQLVRSPKPGPVEAYLARALVALVSQLKNEDLTDSGLTTLDTLLELFIRSANLRACVEGECGGSGFQGALVECLRCCFGHAGSGKGLELVLDLVFVYGYFNRKVSVEGGRK